MYRKRLSRLVSWRASNLDATDATISGVGTGLVVGLFLGFLGGIREGVAVGVITAIITTLLGLARLTQGNEGKKLGPLAKAVLIMLPFVVFVLVALWVP